jgi:peptidyl-dipeptidase Dcp
MTEPNPLLETWSTHFGLPPFDRIRPEYFLPAFEHAMAEHLAEIAAIAESRQAPSFANTIEALERAGRTLRRVSGVFHNLVASLGGEALELLDVEISPRLARHGMQIAQNPALFQRVALLFEARESLKLETDQMRLLERVALSDPQRRRSGDGG